jgi:hypothetical protein
MPDRNPTHSKGFLSAFNAELFRQIVFERTLEPFNESASSFLILSRSHLLLDKYRDNH